MLLIRLQQYYSHIGEEKWRMSVSGFSPVKAAPTLNNGSRNVIIDAEAVVAEAKKENGRHHGKYVDALTWQDSSIRRSIRSCEKTVTEHWDKIENPEKYIADWKDKSEVERTGLILKWKKDIQRNSEQAEIYRAIAKERGLEI